MELNVVTFSFSDKECPMYNQASSSDQTGPSLDPLILVQQMREDGLAMKRSALNIQQHMRFSLSRVGCLMRRSVCIFYAYISICGACSSVVVKALCYKQYSQFALEICVYNSFAPVIQCTCLLTLWP
jgi:hypothetical protein